MAIPKVLLFDLGGVLVDGAGLGELPSMLVRPMAPADLRRKWVASPAVERFETGRCSSREFATAFIEEWGLAIGRDEFLARFATWVGAPYPETAELLSTLGGRQALACLSNTNAVHWESLSRMDGLRPVLGRPFLSHELGMMRPGREALVEVARQLGCEPGEIAYFDDGPENVDGAARAGLSARHHTGVPRRCAKCSQTSACCSLVSWSRNSPHCATGSERISRSEGHWQVNDSDREVRQRA